MINSLTINYKPSKPQHSKCFICKEVYSYTLYKNIVMLYICPNCITVLNTIPLSNKEKRQVINFIITETDNFSYAKLIYSGANAAPMYYSKLSNLIDVLYKLL